MHVPGVLMASELFKGIAIGLLVQFFIIEGIVPRIPILGGYVMWVTIALAVYLGFIYKK